MCQPQGSRACLPTSCGGSADGCRSIPTYPPCLCAHNTLPYHTIRNQALTINELIAGQPPTIQDPGWSMGPLLPRTNDSDPCLGVRGASGPANMCHRRFFRGEALAFTVFLCFSCFKEQELHLQSAEIMYTLMPFRITHGKSKKMNMCFRNQTVCFRNQTVRFRNQTVHFLELDCADSGNDRADSEIRSRWRVKRIT